MLNTISCHFPLGYFPQLYQEDQEDVSLAALTRMDKKIRARRSMEVRRVVDLIQDGINERREARLQAQRERAYRRKVQRMFREVD
jgi:hypothetical protein